MRRCTFIVPLRNKAQWIERCVRSILDQTINDLDVIVSDQGSIDGSYEIVKEIFYSYEGNKNLELLRCPDTDLKSMGGLNVHFNFIHEHVRGDLVISCSADDYNHPRRAEKTLEAFERHNPSYIGTRVQYVGEGQNGEGNFPDRMSRWIAPAECIQHMIGSTASSAWARDLYEKHKPLRDVESQDILLPMLGLMERGLYYIDETLHTYEWHASPENTGIMGQQLAATTDAERMQLNEVGAFHMVNNWISVMRRYTENGFDQKLSPEARQALYDRVFGGTSAWASARLALTMNRIEPKAFRI